jgi:adenylate cyclase
MMSPIPALLRSTVSEFQADASHDHGGKREEMWLAETVTILFTDVEGSTALRNTVGDDVAQRIFDIQEEIVRREVAAQAGDVVKTLGDGFMVGFRSVLPALLAAIAIQRALATHDRLNTNEGVLVRMGLNSGEVFSHNGDLHGITVHAAARIAGKAKGAEILISDVVRQLIPVTAGVSLRPRRPVQLKGFNERWRLYEVLWKQLPSSRPRRTRR